MADKSHLTDGEHPPVPAQDSEMQDQAVSLKRRTDHDSDEEAASFQDAREGCASDQDLSKRIRLSSAEEEGGGGDGVAPSSIGTSSSSTAPPSSNPVDRRREAWQALVKGLDPSSPLVAELSECLEDVRAELEECGAEEVDKTLVEELKQAFGKLHAHYRFSRRAALAEFGAAFRDVEPLRFMWEQTHLEQSMVERLQDIQKISAARARERRLKTWREDFVELCGIDPAVALRVAAHLPGNAEDWRTEVAFLKYSFHFPDFVLEGGAQLSVALVPLSDEETQLARRATALASLKELEKLRLGTEEQTAAPATIKKINVLFGELAGVNRSLAALWYEQNKEGRPWLEGLAEDYSDHVARRERVLGVTDKYFKFSIQLADYNRVCLRSDADDMRKVRGVRGMMRVRMGQVGFSVVLDEKVGNVV